MGVLTLGFHDLEQCKDAYSIVTWLAKIFDILYLPHYFGNKSHIQQIIDCLPLGAALIDRNDIVRLFNKKIVELLQINKKQNLEQDLPKYLSKLGTSKFNYSSYEINDIVNKQTYKLIQLKERHTSKELKSSQKQQNSLYTFDQIIGNSPALQIAKRTAMNVADTSVPVMLFGESGTGKEMFAQAIHSTSPRSNGPFIAINCGAIPTELVESELFGYEEGSFTGALKGGKMGKIEAASGGTLFLDEIESMPVKDQIKLLRVLSTGKVQKVGSTKEMDVDIRLISATKVDLLKQADEGLFREDLYYRISTFIIELPALRDRQGDILMLAEVFKNRLEKKYDLPKLEMDPAFVRALCSYYWRGNVRELEHQMERAVILARGSRILLLEHLSPQIQESLKNSISEEVIDEVIKHREYHEAEQGLIALAEKKLIERVLRLVDGNVTAAAKYLGINRRTIYKKMQAEPELSLIHRNQAK